MGSRIPIEEARAARQSAWRDVNANIALLADRLSYAVEDADRAWTFMCECGRVECRELVTVALGVYRAARQLDRFLVVPGHEAPRDRVLERHEDYLVVVVA